MAPHLSSRQLSQKMLEAVTDFQGRTTSSHQNNATDPINAALNYWYGFLEGECRRTIKVIGLEPYWRGWSSQGGTYPSRGHWAWTRICTAPLEPRERHDSAKLRS